MTAGIGRSIPSDASAGQFISDFERPPANRGPTRESPPVGRMLPPPNPPHRARASSTHRRHRARRILALAVGLGILLLLGSVLSRPLPEPRYDGRTVTEWLKDPDPSARPRMELALTMTGTSAIPVLRNHLRAGTRIERRLWLALPPRWQVRWRRQSRLFGMRLRALEAAETVPGLAAPLTPELLHVLADDSEPTETRVRAFRALALNRTDPALLRDAFPRLAFQGGIIGAAAGHWLAQDQQHRAKAELEAYFEAHTVRSNEPASIGPLDPQPQPRSLPTGIGLDLR